MYEDCMIDKLLFKILDATLLRSFSLVGQILDKRLMKNECDEEVKKRRLR